MKVIPFKESNRAYAADQPEYETLHAWKADGDRQGRIVCLWQLTWRERLRVLWTGQVWHQILTFNKPLQPQVLSAEKPELEDQHATR
jgi:hypothetical protein